MMATFGPSDNNQLNKKPKKPKKENRVLQTFAERQHQRLTEKRGG